MQPRRLLTLSLLLLSSACTAARAAEVAPALSPWLADGPRPVWVFFADKGAMEDSPAAHEDAANRLSARALARRARLGRSADVVGWADLPNDPAYLDWLTAHGFSVRAESRWLAAVTVVTDGAGVRLLATAPFVARLAPVGGAGRPEPDRLPAPSAPGANRALPLDYGGSLPELEQVNLPPLHDLGFHGEGVVVGMLDSGFNTTHEALSGLSVLGAYDFVNDDPVVANEPGDPDGQENHGTETFSTLAGHAPGSLIGPAFGASFYLAKTEDVSQEVPAEEDFWVEGIEWLEANGCDLVSSSLAYDDWYTFEDYDGNTCVTTIAADMAVALGVAVFNSAGNYRQTTGTIAAPADGDSVITVGAVEITGEIAGFSSPGPTADGRIKPDVCALGVSNNVVVPGTLDQYQGASGTSFSCPLTAGVGAVLLGAHPGTSPVLLREALRRTASQSTTPDNDYGWGIVNALAAYEWLGATAAPAAAPAGPLHLAGNWPNPFNPSTRIAFSLDHPLDARLDVLDLQGRHLRRLHAGRLDAGAHALSWDGRDDGGHPVASGVYVLRLAGEGHQQRLQVMLLK
ncbi:MAG: S8 family serine peptidase [Candidatus Krumholzibacteriia bacterium]